MSLSCIEYIRQACNNIKDAVELNGRILANLDDVPADGAYKPNNYIIVESEDCDVQSGLYYINDDGSYRLINLSGGGSGIKDDDGNCLVDDDGNQIDDDE